MAILPTRALEVILIVSGSIVVLAAPGGLAWLVYRACQDRPGRPTAAWVVSHSYPPFRARIRGVPTVRPSGRAARSTST